ncbi:MAG: diacylglycerol kinase [Spongiibacteraceae bacterium]
MMNKPSRRGLAHIVDAYNYSIMGVRAAWRNETAFRQQTAIATVLIPSAFWLGETASQRILLLLPIALVFIVEFINSAIESIVDRIGTELHPLSGQAKDLGSAAVMVAMLFCLASWLIIAFGRFG